MFSAGIPLGQLQVYASGKAREVEMHIVGFDDAGDDFTSIKFYGERVFADGKSAGSQRADILIPSHLAGNITGGPQAHVVEVPSAKTYNVIFWLHRNPPKGIWSMVAIRTADDMRYRFSFSEKNVATMVKVACV